MKYRAALAASVALACLSTVAMAAPSGVQFRGTATIGDVAQDAERIVMEFGARTGALLGGTVVSEVVRYDGATRPATVSGGEMRLCPTSACGSSTAWSTAATLTNGQFVQLRRAGPQAPGARVAVSLSVNGQDFEFSATARSEAPSFGTIAGATADPGAARDSDLATFRGWVEAPITVSGGEYRVCSAQGSCGSFTTAQGVVRDGDQVQLRVVAGAFGASRTASVSAGGATATFAVTTRVKDTAPNAIALGTGPTGVEPGSTATSQTATLAGFDDATISIAGAGAVYSLNGGSFTTTAGTAKAGDTVRVQLTAGAFGESRTATLTVGETMATFASTVRAKDETPDVFSFATATGRQPATVVESASATLAGFDGTAISVTGGEYALNGGSFTTTAGTAKAGDTVVLRVTTGAFGESRTANLTVGGTSASFVATTRVKDTQPDAFAFSVPGGSTPGASVASSVATLQAFDDAPISVTGGEYALNGGSFTGVAGTAKAGDRVQLRGIAPAFGQTQVVSLDVGGVVGNAAIVSRAKDTTPDAFALGTGPTGVEPGSASTSQTATLAGFDDAPISIAGTGAVYSLNGGSFTTSAGTAKAGDTVRVQLTAGAFGETRQATLAVGGTSASWSSTVRAKDITPDAFSFASTTNTDPNVATVSPIARLTGHEGVDVSISGHASAQYQLCTASDCSDAGSTWLTAATTSVPVGRYVRVRLTPTAYASTISASLQAGTMSASFSTTTKTNAAPVAYHTFTSCGATGMYGPSLADCQAAYSASAWATNPNNLNTSSGSQIWTVPETGLYQFTVVGSAGGSIKSVRAGRGASIVARLNLTAGEKLRLVVGQIGIPSGDGAGGGGASMVARQGAEALIVAGGGGGSSSHQSTQPGLDANPTGTNGVASSGNQCGGSPYGGTGGQGGGADCAGGGGGVFSDGNTGAHQAPGGRQVNGPTAYGGQSTNGSNPPHGGFGGGGAGSPNNGYGGGGGGYSGGGGGGWTGVAYGGGGGGSYVISSGTTVTTGYGAYNQPGSIAVATVN